MQTSTELHKAVDSGRLSEVQRCLEDPTLDIDAFDSDGHTPLTKAAFRGHDIIASQLLAAGASVDLTREGKPTALSAACKNGYEHLIRMLLTAGADVNTMTDRSTPLTHATYYNHLGTVRMLLAAGADVNLCVRTAPLHAASRNDHLEIMQMLLDAHANPNITTPNDSPAIARWTPLHYSANRGGIAAVQLLISGGAAVNAPNADGDPPLHVCVYPNMVKFLIESGADYTLKNDSGETPLERAFIHMNLHGYAINRAHYCAKIAVLVSSGDRQWSFVPSSCPGIEAALLPVWKEAPHELRQVFQRLSVESKGLIQWSLRALHGKLEEELRMKILALVLSKEDND